MKEIAFWELANLSEDILFGKYKKMPLNFLLFIYFMKQTSCIKGTVH